MSFFYSKNTTPQRASNKIDYSRSLKALGCRVCPLDKADLIHPKLEPSGADKALIYFLSESPSSLDDKCGEWMAGKPGDFLFDQIPNEVRLEDIRLGGLMRCSTVTLGKPGSDKEIAAKTCCSGLLEKDIEESKPAVIIGLGYAPLAWALGVGCDFRVWNRRWIPIKVGNHSCWFYGTWKPSEIISARKNRGGRVVPSDQELMWKMDIRLACRRALDIEAPEVLSLDTALSDVTIINGSNGEKDLDKLANLLDKMWDAEEVAVDIETTCLSAYEEDARILTIGISDGTTHLAYPLRHKRGWRSQRQVDEALDMTEQFLRTKKTVKTFHNSPFDLEWLAEEFGEEFVRYGNWDDTMGQAYILDNRKGALGLEDLTKMYLGFWLKDAVKLDKSRLEDEPIDTVLRYNAGDVKGTYKVSRAQRAILDEMRNFDWLRQHLRTLVPTLVLAQRIGLVPNKEALYEFKEMYEADEAEQRRIIATSIEAKRFKRSFSKEFDPQSNKDLPKMFKDLLQRPEVIRDGKVTTDEAALLAIPEGECSIVKPLLKLRNVVKMNSTYVTGTLGLIKSTGRIHTTYKPFYTDTGRLASENPNSQNYPKRKNKEVRKGIGAPPGYTMVSIDYGQIEARVIAILSDDSAFKKAVWEGYDVHQHWALWLVDHYPRICDLIIKKYEMAKNEDEKKVIKTLRGDIKNGWVFPQFYGSNWRACAEGLDIPLDVAEEMSVEFWTMFSGVKAWQDGLPAFYEKHGYVETMTGRRRYGPINFNRIINTPVQGTASDIVTNAMNELSFKSFELDMPWLQPVLNIHDDITSYYPLDKLEESLDIACKIMASPDLDWVSVPLLAEAEFGPNWAEQKAYGAYEGHKGWTKF